MRQIHASALGISEINCGSSTFLVPVHLRLVALSQPPVTMSADDNHSLIIQLHEQLMCLANGRYIVMILIHEQGTCHASDRHIFMIRFHEQDTCLANMEAGRRPEHLGDLLRRGGLRVRVHRLLRAQPLPSSQSFMTFANTTVVITHRSFINCSVYTQGTHLGTRGS